MAGAITDIGGADAFGAVALTGDLDRVARTPFVHDLTDGDDLPLNEIHPVRGGDLGVHSVDASIVEQRRQIEGPDEGRHRQVIGEGSTNPRSRLDQARVTHRSSRLRPRTPERVQRQAFHSALYRKLGLDPH